MAAEQAGTKPSRLRRDDAGGLHPGQEICAFRDDYIVEVDPELITPSAWRSMQHYCRRRCDRLGNLWDWCL